MNKVLLTGAKGFLGTYLENQLKLEGYEVITLGRTASDINFDLSKGIPEIPTDINYIVHAAGKAHVVPKNEIENQAFYDEYGYDKIIKHSTDSFYEKELLCIRSKIIFTLRRNNFIEYLFNNDVIPIHEKKMLKKKIHLKKVSTLVMTIYHSNGMNDNERCRKV